MQSILINKCKFKLDLTKENAAVQKHFLRDNEIINKSVKIYIKGRIFD